MEVLHQQFPGITPNVLMEFPHEELNSPNSVSASSSEFSFACTAQPNASLSGSPLDLSPADDIFFYGHLLPLHLFPQVTVSPRSSTNSLDNFTLPGAEFIQSHHSPLLEVAEPVTLPKSKSLGFLKRWRRVSETVKSDETENKKTTKKMKKVGFELTRLLKRYAKLVRPLLIFTEARRNKKINQFKPQPISYSGDLSVVAKQEAKRRRGEYSSAPASIRTSPINSRILLTTVKSVPSPVADSTMEDLQSAIQAAIAHCKNSSISTDGLHKL